MATCAQVPAPTSLAGLPTSRTRILQLAIDARRQRFPQETAYVYRPLAGREDENRWNEQARAAVLKNYNQLDMFI